MSSPSPVIVVVGGGILGLASARALAQRVTGARVLVLEKENRIGVHQTGRASGVVHSGVYYTPGSLKARLCTRGARELIEFCERRGIPFQRCGKVIVATGDDEIPRLEELHRRAAANGVEGAELIGRERLAELEPHAAGVRALHVPTTGIVDFVRVAQAYADDLRKAGGEVLLGHEVTAMASRGSGVLVTTGVAEIFLAAAVKRSALRDAMTTSAPSRLANSAVAKPMPDAPPRTTTFAPASCIDDAPSVRLLVSDH